MTAFRQQTSAAKASHEEVQAEPRLAETPRRDPLVDSLIFLSAFHGRVISREALLSGLPIEKGALSPMLYERAAKRAGLEAELIERRVEDIPALVLPAVLLFKDGTARILLKIENDSFMLLNPSEAGQETFETRDSVNQAYSGFAYFVRPASVSDARVALAENAPRAHWFWSVVTRFGANYTHVAIAAFIVNTLALAAPLFTMSVYDRVVPNGAIPSLIALSIGLGLAIVFDFVLRVVRSRIIDVTGKKIDVVLAADIFEHVMSIKLAQRPASIGILANQLRDFDSVREFFTSGTVVSATDLLFAILFIAALFIVAGPLGWIPLIMLPIMIGIGIALQRPLDRAMRRLQAESSARHGILIESLSGMETVRSIGGEARVQTGWERSVAATARSSEDVQYWSSMALTVASTAQQVSSLLLIVVGVFLILNGQLTVGALVAANMLAGRVLAPIAGLAAVITRGTQTLSALRSIDWLMSRERERPVDKVFVARQVKEGRLEFNDVSFSYPGAAQKALDKISFKVNAGERVGIIGRVGSGKTTVGKLSVGFFSPDEGGILVDGVDIRQYDPADLRSGIGFLLQDTDLFYGKLRDNITFGKPSATDAEVIAAGQLAGVESFIANHPQGYDMMIAEGGRSLSGGQKQAIGLARVLIRKPKVLFLDEPTAHFDVRSETEFLERLKSIANRDTTIIVSTHRLSLLSLVDRILVFERGRIVMDGPRDQVLQRLQAGVPAATSQPAKPARL